jgi:UDP-glucose 4-epimerase
MGVFITGGQGYVGSHVTRLLALQGRNPTVIDNNSGSNVYPQILGAKYVNASINDDSAIRVLTDLFTSDPKGIVIHLSGLKSVENSISNPELYSKINFGSTVNVLNAMKNAGLNRIIFSSSAAVYGQGNSYVTEDSTLAPISQYGKIKLQEEQIIKKYVNDFSGRSAILRFFNVVGCSIPELREINGGNVFPMIAQAISYQKKFKIFGNSYNTPDGTCVRDYIDVEDVANAIEKAISKIQDSDLGVLNIGSGKSTSVLQIVKKVNRLHNFEYEFTDARPGDIPELVADISRASTDLDWIPRYGIDKSIKSSFLSM